LTASPNSPTASPKLPTAPSLLEVELPEPQSEEEVVELTAVEFVMSDSQAALEDEAQPPRISVFADRQHGGHEWLRKEGRKEGRKEARKQASETSS